MNKADRKQLQTAVDLLSNFADAAAVTEADFEDVQGAVNDAQSIVEEIASGERDKFDNLSEGLQNSERGQAIEEAADNLESIDFSVLPSSRPEKEDEVEEWASGVADSIQGLIDEIEALL